MIAIVSTSSRERAALTALCEGRGWVALECDSARAFAQVLRRHPPRVVVMRHQLGDSFSDSIIGTLSSAQLLPATKVIVLAGASISSAAEARQVALGADCVLRDPVRTDVLAEYLAKFQRSIENPNTAAKFSAAERPMRFAGGTVVPGDRVLQYQGKATALTPRELEFVELLIAAEGHILSYDTIYHEMLGRRFRGDSSNLRVLLAKLIASTARVGIHLRSHIEVIPKSGYRYYGAPAAAIDPTR